jgi:hypothetical protein
MLICISKCNKFTGKLSDNALQCTPFAVIKISLSWKPFKSIFSNFAKEAIHLTKNININDIFTVFTILQCNQTMWLTKYEYEKFIGIKHSTMLLTSINCNIYNVWIFPANIRWFMEYYVQYSIFNMFNIYVALACIRFK